MAKKSTNNKATAKRKRPAKVGPETVFEHLKLTSVRLISVDAKLNIIDGKVPDQAVIEARPNAGANPEGTRINANVVMHVVGKPKDAADQDKCSTVIIDVHYQCVYEVHDTEISHILPHGNAIANTVMMVTWPYLRELCNSLTSKMGIPPITLPMLSTPHASSEGLKALVNELESLRKQLADK